MRRALVPLLLALGSLPAARGFDIIECDFDQTFGNAPTVLGWAPPTNTTIGAIVLDTAGAVQSGISGANVINAWEAAITDWADTTNQSFVFPGRSQRAVSGAELGASLNGGTPASETIFMVVQTNTATPSANSWQTITLTGACETLAVTLSVYDLNSRRSVDADILVNDDDRPALNDAGSGPCPFATPFFSFAPTPGRFHLQSVVAHEIGHFLGSDHPTQNAPPLMGARLPQGLAQPITNDDEDVLRFLYRTLASPTQPARNNTTLTVCPGSTGNVVQGSSSSGGGCRAHAAVGGGSPPSLLLPIAALLALELRRRTAAARRCLVPAR